MANDCPHFPAYTRYLFRHRRRHPPDAAGSSTFASRRRLVANRKRHVTRHHVCDVQHSTSHSTRCDDGAVRAVRNYLLLRRYALASASFHQERRCVQCSALCVAACVCFLSALIAVLSRARQAVRIRLSRACAARTHGTPGCASEFSAKK